MKRIIFGLVSLMMAVTSVAAPQALYVMKDGNCTKYNFGVAGDLHFLDNGHKLRIKGYSEIINLDDIDYITFNAPLGATTLTPYEQKEKLIKVGEAVNALVDLNNINGIIKMQDAFFTDHYVGGRRINPPSEYTVPEEYWNVHEKVKSSMNAVRGFVNGDMASLRTFRNKAIELYKATDYFGVYETNDKYEVWVKKNDADFLEIRYKGYNNVNYAVKLVCDTKVATWSVEDVSVEIPVKMTFVFTAEGEEVAEIVLTTDIKQDEKIGMDMTFTAGNYKVVETLDITNPLLSDVVKICVDGEEIINSVTHLYGANLVDYDIMKDDIKEASHYHDEDGHCCGDNPEGLIAHFYRATTDVDILGMLQVKAKALGFSRLYDLYSEYDDAWDGSYGYDNYSFNSDKSVLKYHYDCKNELVALDKINTHYNTYSDAQFFYDGDKTLQGFLSFEMVEDSSYEWYNQPFIVINDKVYHVYVGYDYDYEEDKRIEYYYIYNSEGMLLVEPSDIIIPSKYISIDDNIEPRLTFPDMTSYAYEDFFDEISFKRLITDYQDIIDTYNAITGHK